MKNLAFLFLILCTLSSYAQKTIKISDNNIARHFYDQLNSSISEYNLADLRNSKTLGIRIWKENELISLGENSEYIFHITNGTDTIVKKHKLAPKVNLDSLYQLFKSNKNVDNRLHIDASPVKIELSDFESYDLIVFQKDDQLEGLIQQLVDAYAINHLRKEIIYQLPPGNYRRGMLGLRIDHLPTGDKSDFYRQLEPEIETKLQVNSNTPPTEMPLILIDDKPRSFKDLNELSLSNIRNYSILDDSMQALYGTRARFGVIKVTTH